MTFGDFVHLIVQGPKELADFISENKISGESLGIDTGMVDAKGESAKWDSYWHQCGLCNPEFRPHYILDFAHQKEDEAVSDISSSRKDGKYPCVYEVNLREQNLS